MAFGSDELWKFFPRKEEQPNLDDRETRKLLRSVQENRKRSLSDVTALFNQNWESTVSKRTVQGTLYKQGYLRGIVRRRIRIREVNCKALSWC